MISFSKKDELQPIASRDNPDFKQIFQICTGNINESLICKKRPYRVTETATFIINQNPAKVVHLFGLEKNHNVGFYEYEKIDISPNVSHEITISKNEKGRVVINGTYKELQGKVVN